MHVHVLQHVAFEGLGSIGDWLAPRAARITYTAFQDASAALPDLAGIDLLIALGGPMSVNDEEALPWLRDEKRFIAQVIAAGKPVLGICLGAQLIASALGARVYPGPQKEIGWFPISAAPRQADTFHFPASSEVFHWHGETFDLPDGAKLLASSAVCRNQAFQVGAKVIGLQFHLEMTAAAAAPLIDHCRGELVPQATVQAEFALRSAAAVQYAGINQLMAQVLAYLVDEPASSTASSD